jgi:CheY-like chemotaxis protein
VSVDIRQDNSAHAISVLVVEDETLIRLLASDSLRDAGFDVTAAAHAAEAIEILEGDTRIDFVFTDIMMPGSMNGIGLGAWIRINRPGLPIAYASGVSRASMLGLGLVEGEIRHIRTAVAPAPAASAEASPSNRRL